MIAIIAAVAKNNVIGSKNDLPWYLPEDLKRFKELTSGHTVVMGRKTYESILARLGRPLPNRKNVVISRNTNYAVPEEVLLYSNLIEALEACRGDEKIFIIGGASIFAEGLTVADTLFLTHVHQEYPGDIYFPEVDWSGWKKTSEQPHETFTFAEYHRLAS